MHKQRGLAGEPDERVSLWKSVTGFCVLDAEIQITENQKDGELVEGVGRDAVIQPSIPELASFRWAQPP